MWWLAPIAVTAIGLGFYMFHNTLQTIATQMTPQARGTAVSIFSSALYLGQTAGVAIGALVIDRAGAAPVFLGTAIAFPVLAVWFAYELRRRPRALSFSWPSFEARAKARAPQDEVADSAVTP